MIDYPDIGARIRKARLEKGITQEALAEACDVGVSHISHLECGHTIPSMKLFLSIVNVLDCSADELLCKEVKTARPHLESWLSELVADCDETETKIIADTVVNLKDTLRRHKKTD